MVVIVVSEGVRDSVTINGIATLLAAYMLSGEGMLLWEAGRNKARFTWPVNRIEAMIRESIQVAGLILGLRPVGVIL